ncbi:hypothetical protein ACFP8W_05400, partial [Nocardioides hankookensis]
MQVRRVVQVLLVVVVLGLVGGVIAAGISATMGIRTEAKDVPVEEPTVAPPRPAVAPPAFSRITVDGTLRTRTAVAELRDATA